MNQVEERTSPALSDFEQDITHYFCEVCWPNPLTAEVAICGTDLTGHKYTPGAPEETACAMCVEVMHEPCFKCGS